MFANGRYVNAGTNEIHRYGHKAVEYASIALKANDKGFYSLPVDGGKYWTIGTSDGKYGEYAKIGDTFFSVNRGGFIYAKEGTDKAEKFIAMVNHMIDKMNELNDARVASIEEEEE